MQNISLSSERAHGILPPLEKNNRRLVRSSINLNIDSLRDLPFLQSHLRRELDIVVEKNMRKHSFDLVDSEETSWAKMRYIVRLGSGQA
jgi:hypothetical protein